MHQVPLKIKNDEKAFSDETKPSKHRFEPPGRSDDVPLASETKWSAGIEVFHLFILVRPRAHFYLLQIKFGILDTHVDDPTLLASLAKRYVVWSAQRA